MLTRLQNAVEQWGGKNKLIDQWLNNRRQLLIHYCQLANLPPYDNSPQLPDSDGVHHFCNLLVDYVSEGHFEVYDQVVSECEKHGEDSRQLASRIVPQIAKSTDVALDFNDKFGAPFDDDDERMMELDEALSRLGQAMEERFAFEDKLLDTLHRHYSEELQAQP